jgi:hypothetical protein
MRTNRFLRMLRFLPLVILFAALFTFVIMRLWNWLMPPLFGLHAITFWQALGLFILSKILFGSFRGAGPRRPDWRWRRRMMERWDQMTPEEREKLRLQLRERCGPFRSHATEVKP